MNGKFRFLSLDAFAVQPVFPKEQLHQAGTLSPTSAWNESCGCQESHNTSEITNQGTSEGKHHIHPATSMGTKGNIEEIDQKWKKSLGINPDFSAVLIYTVVS